MLLILIAFSGSVLFKKFSLGCSVMLPAQSLSSWAEFLGSNSIWNSVMLPAQSLSSWAEFLGSSSIWNSDM